MILLHISYDIPCGAEITIIQPLCPCVASTKCLSGLGAVVSLWETIWGEEEPRRVELEVIWQGKTQVKLTSTVNAGPQMSTALNWGEWEKIPGKWPPDGCFNLIKASEICQKKTKKGQCGEYLNLIYETFIGRPHLACAQLGQLLHDTGRHCLFLHVSRKIGKRKISLRVATRG